MAWGRQGTQQQSKDNLFVAQRGWGAGYLAGNSLIVKLRDYRGPGNTGASLDQWLISLPRRPAASQMPSAQGRRELLSRPPHCLLLF